MVATKKKSSKKKKVVKKKVVKKKISRVVDGGGLNIRLTKEGDRKVSTGRADKVTEVLSKCNTRDEISDLCSKFGMTEGELDYRWRRAPNFGQFRMVIGNRLRGISSRMKKAEDKGESISVEAAAGTWDVNAAKCRYSKKALVEAGIEKPAKKSKKKTKKKRSKK